jgi:glycosyltransferase involved in cell wall biosynthesis
MIRVLVLCEFSSLNGGEHSLLEAVKCLDRQQVELHFAAPPVGPLAEAVAANGWDLTPFSCFDEAVKRGSLAELRDRLRQLLTTRRPDLLHANSVSMSRLSGPVAAALQLPSLGHLRDIVRVSGAALDSLRCHRRLLAVSAATHDWYRELGLAGVDLRVAHNGVDLTRFRPGTRNGYLHDELKIERSQKLVGAIGQIGIRKGTDVLLAAMQQVVSRHQDVHVVVVGQRYSQKAEAAEFERQVRQLAEDASLEGRVHWLGVRTDIADLLRELSVYVHAARQEPLGRVLLEAAASGLPIVATDAGGTREIFPATTDAAEIVPVGSVQTLAGAVQRLLADPSRAQRLGRSARARSAAFNIQDVARNLVRHYLEVAGSSPRAWSNAGP